MGVLAGLVSLAALSLFYARALQRSASFMPLLAAASAMVYFTLAGCLGLLRPAAVLWYALCAVALLYTLWREKGRILHLFTPGLVFFLVGGVLLVGVFQLTRPMLTLWDEFTFWGTAAKATCNTHLLYTVAPSNLIARSYPPGMVVFTYMMQFFGGFTEPGFIACYGILMLACFSAASALWDKNKSAAVVALAALCLFPLLFETAAPAGRMMYSYLSTMVDMPMAMVFGGALCFYLAGGEKDTRLLAPFAVILAALVCMKDIGLALALIAWFMAALDLLFCSRGRLVFLRLRRGKALLAFCGVCLAAIVACYLLWAVHMRTAGLNRFNLGSSGEEMGQLEMLFTGIKMLFGVGRTQQFSTVAREMLYALVKRPVFLLGPGVVALALILALAVAALLLAADGSARRRVVVFTLGMGVCFAAFYIFNLFTYALIFKPIEAESLREYQRYIFPFWAAWLMAGLVLLAQTACNEKAAFYRRRAARAVNMGAAVVLIAGVLLRFGWQANFLRISPSLYTQRTTVAGVLATAREEGLRDEDKVYLISQGDDATRFYIYGFEMQAERALMYTGYQMDYTTGRPVLGTDGLPLLQGNVQATLVAPNANTDVPYEIACTPQALARYLKETGCTHLLLDTVDEYILTGLVTMFADGLVGWSADTRGHTYYRVTWDRVGTCTLVPQEGGAP
ncbi:hypothetical protein LJC04_04590 [Ruminococcaceae bacterium OttesenSCG-928-O06]|nr:hypothetical protein [Ruminococcaceae bacterium OttesenSCG-928-O06]